MNQTMDLAGTDLENMLVSPLNLTDEQLKDREACFELFKKCHRENQALEDNKKVLKEKTQKAKHLGAMINNARNHISELKIQIEELRKDKARQGLEDVRHPDEDKIVKEIDNQKQIYKNNFDMLKDLKAEIENIQAMMERIHQEMQKDFEEWLDVVLNQNVPKAQQSQSTAKNTFIDIFLRVRPTKEPYDGLELLPTEQKVEFRFPRDETKGFVSNQKKDLRFQFNETFGMESKQEDIFNNVVKDVADAAFDGRNGTLFAYGQIGSGKTFTMTGGSTERYVDRGIIPRTLSYVFLKAKNRPDTTYRIGVSYVEIYNNEGYDLLDENRITISLSDLPKVIPMEWQDGRLVLSGLSIHTAETLEQALKLFFIGDANRVVSETPKNDVSTRSHCIFIIQIEGQKADGTRTVGRVYLVDLSGTGKVGKTEAKGKLLTETRHINSSLHHLEHVIDCLKKKAKGKNTYVPYRSSLMTLILKDALGGNNKTRMIATISAEKGDIDESICTCRFAQRVAN